MQITKQTLIGMLLQTALFLSLVIILLAYPARAESNSDSPLIPRQDLFGNPEKISAEVSPDGKRIAWLAPVGGVMNVWVAPIENPSAAVPITDDKRRGIRAYHWSYDGVHLVYVQDQGGDENWHVYAVDVANRTTKDLTPFPGVRASLAGVSRKLRGEILVTLNKRDPRYPDLFRVDLTNGATTLAAENTGFSYFVADDTFTPRLAWRTTPAGGGEILRAKDGGWEPWLQISPEDTANTAIITLDSEGNALFMLDSRGRNTAALTRIDLSTGNESILAEDPRADIGGIITDRDTHVPLAYAVTYLRKEYEALGARLKPDLEFLSKSFGGEWAIGSRSEDDKLWTVSVSSDIKPASSYLYDRDAKTLTKLFDAKPKLTNAPLSAMHPVIVKARDGLDLVSYLTLPKGSDDGHKGRPDAPLPMVLFVHGGPWSRDTFGYHAMHQWLANRGYAVLSVNFRGSTGFGKAFVNAADKEWGRKMDDDLLDAVSWAIREKIADPKRVGIMGGSYGGYATLAGMTRDPDTYACGVDLVGPSELELLIKTIPPYWAAGRPKFVKAIGNPDTDEGRALLRERSPLYQADKIKKPLLIAQGENDPRVKKEQSDQIVETLHSKGIPVTYLLYRREGHGFAEPENNISFAAIAESFLSKCLGGRAAPITPLDLKGTSVEIPVGADLIEGYTAAKGPGLAKGQ
jgi:dipeptidyl aminopeptidase/acylaminoacyl peptidase